MPRLDLLTANDRPGLSAELVCGDGGAAAAVSGAGGARGGRRLRGRRRLHRAVGGAAPGGGRARRRAARGAARRLGRVGAERRAGRVGAAAGPGLAGGAASAQERARALWDMAEEAKALVRGLVARHGIACDLRPGVIHAACRAGEVAGVPRRGGEARARLRLWRARAARPGRDRGACSGRAAYHGGVLDRGAGHLHPLNYALGLARAAAAAGVRIFEASRVEAVAPGAPRCGPARGAVRARFVLVAGNGYLGGLVPEVAARVMPINNFIVATAPLGEARARGADPRRRGGGGLALRGQLLPPFGRPAAAVRRRRELWLALPARHRRRWCGRGCWRSFPQLADVPIDYAWGGTLAITVNRMPAFQRLGPTVFSAAAATPGTAWRWRRWRAS